MFKKVNKSQNKSTQKENTKSISYSIKLIVKKYVNIDTNQKAFEVKKLKEQTKMAKRLIPYCRTFWLKFLSL